MLITSPPSMTRMDSGRGMSASARNSRALESSEKCEGVMFRNVMPFSLMKRSRLLTSLVFSSDSTCSEAPTRNGVQLLVMVMSKA